MPPNEVTRLEKIRPGWFLSKVVRHALSDQPWMVIGNFDGFHRGHQTLVQYALKQSNSNTLAVTFFPHPREVLAPLAVDLKTVDLKKDPGSILYIDTLASRIRKLLNFGVSQVWVVHFTREFAQITWQTFCETLFFNQGFTLAGLCVGRDFRFGHNREGTAPLVEAWLHERAVPCHIFDDVMTGAQRISSVWIRSEIEAGNFERVVKELGCDYEIAGVVQKGPHLGRKLGFPTANVYPSERQLIPPRGVYVAQTVLEGRKLLSVINVGVRPTVSLDSSEVVVESHILDFHENIYGKYIEVRFLRKLREEKKFPTLEALKAQIQKDVDAARQYGKDTEGKH